MTTTHEPLAGPEKAPTGIAGFDDITGGGVPRGRPTLVTGAAGSGKTLFGIEFLVRGARDFGEPGVLLAFEEAESDLATNVASLGFDLAQLERDGLLAVDAFRLDPSEIVETGAFDLDGLFIRLAAAVESVGAKRVVLDTIELLFSALPNEAIIRGELGRLFRWCKERDLTVVVTGERGDEGSLTRFGIEEYVSDCVVSLDHRVHEEVSTRRLRVVKYRGSLHGTNEYPFLITDRGIVVVPITSVGLGYEASEERVSTGIDRLDQMLAGGVYRGSAMMISGTAGTGKTSIGASMATQHVPAARRRCSSRWRSHRPSWCATCARSGSTCSLGWTPGCCRCARCGPLPSGSRSTWRCCTGSSRTSSRRSSCSTPSPA